MIRHVHKAWISRLYSLILCLRQHKATDYDKAMQPEVWPYRVGVRRFIPKRPKNDWASQSASSGGNIQRGPGRHASAGGHGHHNRGNHRHPHNQFAPSAPSTEQFYLPTQNRFNGLHDNVDN